MTHNSTKTPPNSLSNIAPDSSSDTASNSSSNSSSNTAPNITSNISSNITSNILSSASPNSTLNPSPATGVEHTPFDARLWTGRHEPYETKRARYWYQVVQASNLTHTLSDNQAHTNIQTTIVATHQTTSQPQNTSQPQTNPTSSIQVRSDIRPKVSLVGFACDQGVRRNLGRVGAKAGPNAIRQAFANLPLSPALQTKYSNNDSALTQLLADTGNVVCHDSDTLTPDVLEQTQLAYSQQVTQIIQQNCLAIGLGGGHAIAYASYMGLWHALNPNSSNHKSTSNHKSETNTDTIHSNSNLNIKDIDNDTETATNPTSRIGIINFDAHFDIRNAPKGTSGTPFRQIYEHNSAHHQPFDYCAIGISQFSNSAALFDRADELKVTIISDDACHRTSWEVIATQLNHFIDKVDVVYLTIDMDAFPASIVPAVSAPAVKGIDLDFAERCIETIFQSGKVKMVDIAEINPTYDIDGRSSKVAARLLALMIEHYLLMN